jgi:hypothetical protein
MDVEDQMKTKLGGKILKHRMNGKLPILKQLEIA